MLILGINRVLNWLQITTGGRKYTCPIKMIEGETFFKFKNVWHRVADYLSDYAEELIEVNGKIISKKIKS